MKTYGVSAHGLGTSNGASQIVTRAGGGDALGDGADEGRVRAKAGVVGELAGGRAEGTTNAGLRAG
jgi:hypothetical protein